MKRLIMFLACLAMISFSVPGLAVSQVDSTETDQQTNVTQSGSFELLKMRNFQMQANELKEKILRTKQAIQEMQKKLVAGSIGLGARVKLIHRNQMSGAFKLLSASYSLDGRPFFSKVDVNGDLDSLAEKEILHANILEGNHSIVVRLVFQGQGYGFFDYVEGYKIKVTSSYTFCAEQGKLLSISVVGFERDMTVPFEQRPSVRYDLEVEMLRPASAEAF
jgi:hypothetical protein